MQIGDRVRPVDTFKFGVYGGPENAEDRGVVTEFDDEGDVIVQWDSSGKEFDHVVEGSEYYRANTDAFEWFGVVPA